MVDVFLPRWQACVRRTDALLESARPIDESFRPLMTYRSINEQIAHILAARRSIVRGLITGEFGWQEEMAHAISTSGAERDLLARKSSEDLEELIRTREGAWWDEPARELPRSEWLWALLEHETHHAGQLSMMIRLAGGDPAHIFE